LSFRDWFDENESALCETHVDRERNTIVARELLPAFLAKPAGWAAICYLRAGGSADFHAWRATCPESLRPFAARLEQVFTRATWGDLGRRTACAPPGARADLWLTP